MSINLSKGGSINLTKEDPSLEEVVFAGGWDANAFDTGFAFDLDMSAFCCGANGKCRNDKDFVFYGKDNQVHPSGAIIYGGDNKTGSGDGDDEFIEVDLNKVPADIEKIAFTVTIYEATARNQNFGQISNAYIRLYNKKTGVEIARHDLTEDFGLETAVVLGELYRYNGEWKFKPIAAGFNDGLAGLARNYGLDANGG